MKTKTLFLSLLVLTGVLVSSCTTNKKFTEMQSGLQAELQKSKANAEKCIKERGDLDTKLQVLQVTSTMQGEEILKLENQIKSLKIFRDKQLEQVTDLTVLSHVANENIKKSLEQLEKKEKYIYLLQNAKTKADSINLVLSVNLKNVLKDNIEDKDINISVDKTVVFINISDKMMFKSGSSELTEAADLVLQKVAKVIKARADIEVMVEGYTDNDPIKSDCIIDNWDLSVKRSTAVVRILQNSHKIDPNMLIAAGRGQYNSLKDNSTKENKAANRRTRIIILPKLNQFYDLLAPENM